MSAKVEKVFHFYEDLLPELREVVVEEMEGDDRCRFTRCSKLSQKEAKSSKNFIRSLIFYAYPGYSFIQIGYINEHEGKWLFIEEEDQEKIYLRCKSMDKGVLWREELESSTDVVQYSAALFKELLAEYQTRIKSLEFVIYQRSLENYDFGIRNLNNLERLGMVGSIDSLQEYFSKLRKPLKYLDVDSDNDTSFPAECEEIYQVRDEIVLSRTILSYQQMLQLRAPVVIIPFGDITEMDICNFIQSWQNGTLGKEVKSYRWECSGILTFYVPRLFRLLGLIPVGLADRSIEFSYTIRHNTDAGKRATLNTSLAFFHLLFKVEND